MHLPAPHWLTHVYWSRKEQFLLVEDTYEDWVMFIIEEGRFQFRIGQHDGFGEAGDIVVCPPYHRFARQALQPLSFHFVLFGLDAPEGAAPRTARLPFGLVPIVAGRERLAYNNEQLRSLVAERGGTAPSYRDHLLLDTWYLLIKEWRAGAGHIPSPPEQPQMRQAAELLRQRAFSGGDIRSVAQELDLTPVQFTRRFQAAFRVTPIHYLTSVRLHRACRLLADTDLTLDDIAQACGYENGFYLSRLFQKHMNMRPSDYRRTHRL